MTALYASTIILNLMQATMGTSGGPRRGGQMGEFRYVEHEAAAFWILCEGLIELPRFGYAAKVAETGSPARCELQ